MGKKSRQTPAAPLPLPCDRCAKKVPAKVARRCPRCELAVYCSKECQRAAWSGGHKGQCQAMKRADILKKARHQSLGWAAFGGDMAAVRALMEAGADVEEVDEEHTTPAFDAVQGGHLAVLVYLVEECGASMTAVNNNGGTFMHAAAQLGRLDIVHYVAKNAPEIIDTPDNMNHTPIISASDKGMTPVVRHLARLGCSLSHTTANGHNALDYARRKGYHDTVRLLSGIASAGGWRQYAAACRMAYVRIRHEVSKTYAVLDEGHDDRELLHLMFGRNRATIDAAAREEDGSEKPKAMQVLPEDLFRLVCRFLQAEGL